MRCLISLYHMMVLMAEKGLALGGTSPKSWQIVRKKGSQIMNITERFFKIYFL